MSAKPDEDDVVVRLFRLYRRNNRLACKHLRSCAKNIRDGLQEEALLEALRAIARMRWADIASQKIQKELKG